MKQKRLQFDAGMEFVWVEPSTFMMGRPITETDYFAWEFQHPVTLTQGYWIQTTPVTQKQWLSVMNSNPSKFTSDLQIPVHNLSWNMAQQFIHELNLKTNQTFCLPTEAQWECASRAGAASHFWWGDDASLIDDYAWCHSNANKTPHPVGLKKPNPWELYDCYGNVYEWVSDRYREHPLYHDIDPLVGESTFGREVRKERVLRGGNYYLNASGCNSYSRGLAAASKVKPFFGFRLALTCYKD